MCIGGVCVCGGVNPVHVQNTQTPARSANQSSSALTNLDVVPRASVRRLMQIWPHNSVRARPAHALHLPNRAGQRGQVSVGRLTAVTHTVLYGGHLLSQPFLQGRRRRMTGERRELPYRCSNTDPPVLTCPHPIRETQKETSLMWAEA